MYKPFFGLTKAPFGMSPDPAFLFLTGQHREALVGLAYAIVERKGFVTLIGEAGTGKTTILARALQHFPTARVQTSVILNPTLSTAEFLELAMLDFGISDIPASKAQRITRLQHFLIGCQREERIAALIVDEAQKLSSAVLEEVRLLGNFDYGDQKLLQIILVAQPELNEVLNREDLRQLKQRIALRLSVDPLAPADVQQYIRHRWNLAGGGEPPFSPEAVAGVVRWSRGIPRLINAICDNALMIAYAGQSRRVSAAHVMEAASDLDLTAVRAQRPTPPQPELVPRPETAPAVPPIRTFEVYTRPSLLARWACKLRLQKGMA